MNRITPIQTDITTLKVDAIVNAANEWMLGGGGVDGAIHDAAGPDLLEACRRVPEARSGIRCPTGEARITPGFGLSATYVIHAVGPIWQDGQSGERELLEGCYTSALEIAVKNRVRTIAFPAISCGVFGYPVSQAAEVAVETVSGFLAKNELPEQVLLVAFGPDVLNAIERAVQGI